MLKVFFQTFLKLGHVCCIYKGIKAGLKSSISAWRPITLLPTLSKVAESVLHKRLLDYFFTNSVIAIKLYANLTKRASIGGWSRTPSDPSRKLPFLDNAPVAGGHPHSFLDGREMMALMESRGETLTFVELRAMVCHLPAQKLQQGTGKMAEINFLEWCCVTFTKEWSDMVEKSQGDGATIAFVMTDEMRAEIAELKAVVDAAAAVEKEMRERHEAAAAVQAEADAARRRASINLASVGADAARLKQQIADADAAEAAAQAEVDAHLAAAASGTASVSDKRSLFKKMESMKKAGNAKMSNADAIKAEAAKRREKKAARKQKKAEAKAAAAAAEIAAVAAAAAKEAEDERMAQEAVALAAQKLRQKEAKKEAELKRKEDEKAAAKAKKKAEKAARKARKAALLARSSAFGK